jgi:tetratricopeptide (TPR) repeat protein
MIKIKNKKKFSIFLLVLVAFVWSGFYLVDRIKNLRDASNGNSKVDEAYNAGMIKINSGDFESASEILEQAVKEDQNSPEKLKMLAISQYNQKKYQEAEANFNKLLEKDEANNFSYFNNLANIYRDQKDFEKAVDYYEKAIASNPKYETAYLNLAILYKIEQQKMDEYKNVVERGLKEIPESEALKAME